MASRRPPSKPLTAMEKRTPRNPKYENVQSTLDTGASVTNYMAKAAAKKKYEPKKDEKFRRIRPARFEQLVSEDHNAELSMSQAASPVYGSAPGPEGDLNTSADSVDLDEMMDKVDLNLSGPIESTGKKPPRGPSGAGSSAAAAAPAVREVMITHGRKGIVTGGGRKMVAPSGKAERTGSLNSILTGEYEVPQDAEPKATGRGGQGGAASAYGRAPSAAATPRSALSTSMQSSATTPVNSFLEDSQALTAYVKRYLLLDVRDPDEFAVCHLRNAVNYPAAMLSRATNYFTPDIYAYKNKGERLIIVYDNDERVAALAAKGFFEKGVDNIVLLSGGLKAMAEEYPYLIEGEIPEELQPPPAKPATARTNRSRAGSLNDSRGSTATSRVGDRTNRSTSSTVRSSRTAASRRSLTSNTGGGVEHPKAFRM